MSLVKAVMWLLVGAAFTIGLVYFGLKGVTSILDDQAVWKSGVATTDVSVQGKERSNRIILKTYELEVQYLDGRHAPHRSNIEFTSLFSSVDPKTDPVVHYDAQDPSRFALNWAVDVAGGRWMAAIFFLLGGPLLGFGSLKLAQAQLAKRAAAQAASGAQRFEGPSTRWRE